jgi:selenide,water dikinase
MQDSQLITQDLVLVGGGHSHAIALKQLGMNPLAGVRVTLITDVAHTPYSGMLPGYVAGLYDFDDCHIDLQRLSQFANGVMVRDRAVGLDLQQNRVLLANHPPIAFDYLSLDIGSTPAALTVPGAAEHTIPVKPISQFLHNWDRMVDEVTAHPNRPLRIAVVGGGAGGVELSLAIQARLNRIYQAANLPSYLTLHLFHRGERLIPERSKWVGQKLQQILEQRGAAVHLGERVAEIKPGGIGAWGSEQTSTKKVICESGLTAECDWVFWVTQAAAAAWLAASGLATNQRGFVLVNDCFQSSHPRVFATGDVATMSNHLRPKAGVFAVRQGKPLVKNLRRALTHQPLRPFVPQKEFLILVGAGERSAVASRGSFAFGPLPLLWRWKEHIDRKFMRQFSELEPMGRWGNGKMEKMGKDTKAPLSLPHPTPTPMPCAGCGSKVGSTVLHQALTRIRQEMPQIIRSDVLLGLDAADDGAVLQVPAGQVLVQTVDQFRALINDPFVFGQICANHCLSDLFAMGATPQSALAIVTLPYATEPKLEETLYQLLAGAVNGLHQAGAVLVGGHTAEGAELALGLACNGLVDPTQLWRKQGMRPGQALILTKALGTGTLFAAAMQLQAKGRWIEAAVEAMRQSNQAAAKELRESEASACTDVTGFGLLGHLLEMVRAAQVAVTLDLHTIPILPGANHSLEQGIVSSLYPQNLRAAQQIENLEQVRNHPLFPILFDPQTAGGLLASVPLEQAEGCLKRLRAVGYGDSQIIGQVMPLEQERPITIRV